MAKYQTGCGFIPAKDYPEWTNITRANIIQLRDEFSAWYKIVAPDEWVAPDEAVEWAIEWTVEWVRKRMG